MRRRARAVLIAAAVAALAIVPVGIAQTGSSGNDERGDVEGSPAGGAARADIVRATAGRDSRGRLVHKVTVAGNAADPAGGGLVPLVYIEVPDDPASSEDSNGQAECTFFVGSFRGRLGVFRCGTAERTGSASVVRTSATTTRYTFSRHAIANPSTYDWAVVTRDSRNERGAFTQHDRLPTPAENFIRYRVR